MKHERNVIAIDFDDTITLGGRWWKEDEECLPNEKIVKWVQDKYRAGSVIIIHTARPWELARQTIAWLVKFNVPYHGVNFNKMGADLYVDDKCTNVKDVYGRDEDFLDELAEDLTKQYNKKKK